MVFNKDGVPQKHNQRRRKKIYWTHLQKISDQNKYPIRLCKMLACRDVFVLFCFFCFCKQTVQCYKCTLLSSYINYTCPPRKWTFFCVYICMYIYRYPKQAYLKRNTCSTPVSLLFFWGCTSWSYVQICIDNSLHSIWCPCQGNADLLSTVLVDQTEYELLLVRQVGLDAKVETSTLWLLIVDVFEQ